MNADKIYKNKEHYLFFKKLREPIKQTIIVHKKTPSLKEFSLNDLLSNKKSTLSIIKNDRIKEIINDCLSSKSRNIKEINNSNICQTSKKKLNNKKLIMNISNYREDNESNKNKNYKKEFFNNYVYNSNQKINLPLIKSNSQSNLKLSKRKIISINDYTNKINYNLFNSNKMLNCTNNYLNNNFIKGIIHNQSSKNLYLNNRYRKIPCELFKKKNLTFQIKNVEYISENGLFYNYLYNETENKVNQDRLICMKNLNSKVLGNISLFGILDGHGKYGHLVSEMLKKFLINFFENSSIIPFDKNKENYFEVLNFIIENATNYLKNLSNKSVIDCSQSGTTCLLLFSPSSSNINNLYCCNIGDSRAVLFSEDKVIPLSNDHKPFAIKEKERILKNGGEIITNSRNIDRVYFKNQGYPGLSLTRSIGDFLSEEIGIISKPEITKFSLNKDYKNSFIVMASDGLWDYLSNEEISEIGNNFFKNNCALISTKTLSKQLYETAKNKWINNNFSRRIDDTTIIVISIE